MTLYACGDKQDAGITFLITRFYTIARINKNANNKKYSNAEFPGI